MTPPGASGPVEEEYRLMSVDEIINGSRAARYHSGLRGEEGENGEKEEGEEEEEEDLEDDFPGLIPLVESYLDSVNVDVKTRCELSTYLDLIRKRASGKLVTTARWIREYVASHPKYGKDSVVSEEINRDLIREVLKIGEREASGQGFKGLEAEVRGFESLLGGFRARGFDGS